MKRFALPVSLAVLVFAQACTDATSPDRHATLTPTNPLVVLGNVPPPPTKTAITVTVTSTTAATAIAAPSPPCTFASGAFEGTYFANGSNIESGLASTAIGDPELGLQGTAWLRLDNKQPPEFATTASANARFQRTDQKLSGHGTLVFFGTCVVTIDQVTDFTAFATCTQDSNAAGQPCAEIQFDGTIGGQPAHGFVQAFNRDFCTTFVDDAGHTVFDCPVPEGGS